MTVAPRKSRFSLTVGAVMAIAFGSVASPSAAADPLSDVPFAVGTSVLFDERRNDGRQGRRGSWSLEEGRLDGGRLRLRFVIEPPPHGLAVQSGPAVLFAGMQVYGGSGDMGAGESIDALATVVLPPCDDDDCRYVAEIDLPTHEIPGAIRRLERNADLMWVSTELTLVRTFGAGQWLQVTPFMAGTGDGGVEGLAGRLGAIEPVGGILFPYGLFLAEQATPVAKGHWMFTTRFDYGPVVERLRKSMHDATAPLAMANGSLRVDIAPSCEHVGHLAMHDADGDRVFDVDAYQKNRIEADVSMPIGVPWHLTVHDRGGIDFDQGRMGWGIRAGWIESDGSPIAIEAAFACEGLAGTGTVTVVGGVAPRAAPAVPDREHRRFLGPTAARNIGRPHVR